MTDIINALAGIAAEDPLDLLRDHRAQAKENAQLSFEALLEPVDPGSISYRDRYAVAAFTAGLLGSEPAEEFYRDLLRDEDESASLGVAQLLDEAGFASGPYGIHESAALAGENVSGPWFRVDEKTAGVLSERAAAGLEFAHLLVLHPRDARPVHLARLLAAGWDEDGIVTLAQLVSFLNFQIRISSGLAALVEVPVAVSAAEGSAAPTEAGTGVSTRSGAASAGRDDLTGGAEDARDVAADARALAEAGDRISSYPDLHRPPLYQQAGLGWVPWIAPVAEADLTDVHREALVEAGRAKNAYFRLLVRDPDALRARTLTDFDIFFNTTDGLGRAEREIAATAASRLNGCLFCASVHSDRAAVESGRRDTVQRLLDDGVDADLGDPVWNAVVAASVALTRTPQTFGPEHVSQLRDVGLDDGDIIDVLNCATFFNWANRLMLTLGEPEVIAPGR
ncbi:CMD domain protein/alkylhydroperoxidase domain protein [Brevibacterium sanguinis]|uniref:CMD domain protein/alkylhydroperoxidase domain protein n=2 Tax=Brevibacterium TaxID=1696 RepID=A0A366IHD5_9MICO|nr:MULTISPECIES: alkylhydroperoxidase domain protein [Brevibacterium]RBP63457.1 CMD domain protein/alkylhydroperoxidase domain protein [Brevibacterium sanguinis]RBP69924.1 CMD domain protein/alkylhydroperoxidase domain protein [Brevibacterium celere]